MKAPSIGGVTWVVTSAAVGLWLLASGAGGCASSSCLRNTDCPPGYECSRGGCRVAPRGDAGNADAGDAGGDAMLDSSTDAGGDTMLDSSTDAGTDAMDASADAHDSQSCDPDAEAGTESSCGELDGSADANVDAQPGDAHADVNPDGSGGEAGSPDGGSTDAAVD
ncbi:MAG: hypothetical protein R3B89_18045 [Polyangiaceae bacterium]